MNGFLYARLWLAHRYHAIGSWLVWRGMGMQDRADSIIFHDARLNMQRLRAAQEKADDKAK